MAVSLCVCPTRLRHHAEKVGAGECEYEVHEDHIEFDRLKKDYDALDGGVRDRLGYERALVELLEQLVRDMDRKIQRARERVESENKPRLIKSADQAKLDAIKEQEKGALLSLAAASAAPGPPCCYLHLCL